MGLPTDTVSFLFADIEGSPKFARGHLNTWEGTWVRCHTMSHLTMESNHEPVFHQFHAESLEPVFYWIFQGLYLIMDIPLLITEGGFQIEQMEVGYLIPFPKSASYCWWDVALLE